MPTSYDVVAYPSRLFDLTHPSRLGVMATLHGLTPAPLETARVLEVGCGEGYNLMGMAAAYPNMRLEGLDLAETAIAAGQERARAAGLANVRLWAGDILDAKAKIEPGSFDYIVAHGVYAWVPAEVREGLIDLFAHALAPGGVAHVSYNALPGGHFRMVLRDELLHQVGHIADPIEKIAAARRVIQELAELDPQGEVKVACLQMMAEKLVGRDTDVLFHDELNDIYAPHSLSQVVAHGARAGLRYLADSDFSYTGEHLLAAGDDPHAPAAEIDRVLLHRAQTKDNRSIRFFRNSLFVRADAPIDRTRDLRRLDRLWVSTDLVYNPETDGFEGTSDRRLKFENAPFTAAFRRLVAARPGRLPLAELIEADSWREVFMTLVPVGYVEFHSGPAPFPVEIGEKPETSAFVRFAIDEKRVSLPRLDHKELDVEQSHVRALLQAANGERTLAEIVAALDGVFPADEVGPALNAAARNALMRA